MLPNSPPQGAPTDASDLESPAPSVARGRDPMGWLAACLLLAALAQASTFAMRFDCFDFYQFWVVGQAATDVAARADDEDSHRASMPFPGSPGAPTIAGEVGGPPRAIGTIVRWRDAPPSCETAAPRTGTCAHEDEEGTPGPDEGRVGRHRADE